MTKDLDRPQWRGQRPWLEIYVAVIVDDSKRRALWLRHTLTVPKDGDGRATIWGAWFDAAATPPSRARKRIDSLEAAETGDGERLIQIGDSHLSRGGAAGHVPDLAWDLRWWGGRPFGRTLPAWLPAPTHARGLLHDADCEGTVTVDGSSVPLRGRVFAAHLWGRRHVPTVHWVWAPWLGDGSLEITAVSFRDRLSLGLSDFLLDAPRKEQGNPATAAHPHGLITATMVSPRSLVHTHTWAEADELVGYAYRDTDDRDLMVAQSAIGSAHHEAFTRRAPGLPWRLVDERRSAGGVAVEIHQRAPLPGVDYIGWDATSRTNGRRRAATAPRGDVTDWPALGAIVALGLTYKDHAKETGQALAKGAPPAAFGKHARAFVVGDAQVHVPTSDELHAALVGLDPALASELTARLPLLPAVMDYEGEVALVALETIDDEALAAGTPQPLGLAACNDLTARICQVLGEGTPAPFDYWALAKSFPRFLPVASRVWVPDRGLARMPEITLVTRVNGEERQRASTKLLIPDLTAIVRTARSHLGRPLVRGDVILTGTPSGVGLRLSAMQRRLARFVKDRLRKAELLVSTYATSNALLRPGDVVEVDAGPAGSVRARLTV